MRKAPRSWMAGPRTISEAEKDFTMLHIVVPMAGRGSRFTTAGYTLPKPLIPVHGVPMIQLVVANLRPQQLHRFVFLCQQDHLDQFPMEQTLREVAPNCCIVPVSGVTQGAACTVLLAREQIATSDPLMIANSDQWVDYPIDDYLATLEHNRLDGLIMTMTADDPKWSFVRPAPDQLITEVVEKRVISNEATVGIYNFRHGSDFVAAAEQMIEHDLRVNGEFYVAPVYNQLIADHRRISYVNVGAEGAGMYGVGIPADLRLFEGHPASARALEAVDRCRVLPRAA